MLRIDSHVLYREDHPPEHLASILARNRFNGAILVAPTVPALDCVLGLVIPIDLYDLKLPAQRFLGVAGSLQGKAVPNLTEFGRLGVPLDLELLPGQLSLVERVADQVPRVVINHMARPHFAGGLTAEWAHGMDAAARIPNVYCKISGLLSGLNGAAWSAAAIRPFVQHVLSVFGTERVMFGSEWPLCLPTATWKETLAAFTQSIGANPMDVRERLLGGNAQRFYGLSE